MTRDPHELLEILIVLGISVVLLGASPEERFLSPVIPWSPTWISRCLGVFGAFFSVIQLGLWVTS